MVGKDKVTPFPLVVGSLLLAGGCVFNPPSLTSSGDVLEQDMGGDLPQVADADRGPDQHLVDLLQSDESTDTKLTPDKPIVPDGPGPEAKLPDAKPPDTKLLPDLPPCVGLTCPLSCNAAQNRCYRLLPSNNLSPSSFYNLVTKGLSFTTTSGSINTSNGQIMNGSTVLRAAGGKGTVQNGIYWGVISQSSGPDISVFGTASMTIASGAAVLAQGTNAMAIYSKGQVTILGYLTAASTFQTPGPGGYAGGAAGVNGSSCWKGEGLGGMSGSAVYPFRSAGGGGGGRGAYGGDGGDGINIGTSYGGTGGAPFGPVALIPLIGGCGGGGGWGTSGGVGGGGGGAIQISADGPISVSGYIRATGGGAKGGTQGGAGGGGGSGGAVLLEGVSIVITGIVAANGGGGGSGAAAMADTTANNGQPGLAKTTPALGGTANGAWGGAGGNGGALAASPGADGSDQAFAGGGGGAVGRIRLNAKSIIFGASQASPTPSQNTTVGTW